MMEEKRGRIHLDIRNFVRGIVTGLVVAPVIALYSFLISWANGYNKEHRILILLLPVGAVIILFLFRKYKSDVKNIISYAIDRIHDAEDLRDAEDGKIVSIKMAFLSFFSAFLSHLLGASVGKEGSGVQIAVVISEKISCLEKRFFEGTRRDYYFMAGFSSAFSALFLSPVAGTLFGAHLASPRLNRMDGFLICLTSSYTSYFVASALNIHIIQIPAFAPLAFTLDNTVKMFLFALLIGALSRFTCFLMEFFKISLNRLYRANEYLKVIIPALLVSVISFSIYFITGSFTYNGLSSDLISTSMTEGTSAVDFLLKFILIIFSLQAGFQGGEVVPLLVLGATFSSPFATLLSLDRSALVALSSVAFLSAGMKLPLVGFALAIELFGYTEPAILFLTMLTSFLASGKSGIYDHQNVR